MADIAAALTELGVIESFLRSRYHYPHPIFSNLDALREHLKDDEAPSEPEEASEPKVGEAQPAPPEPTRRRSKRKTTEN